MLAASIAVGIMIVPLVASLSEDAIRRCLDRCAKARTRWAQRSWRSLRVIVPAALSGIVASFILAASRAVGETMIVALAAGS